MPRSRISVTAKILPRSLKPLLYSLVKHNCCQTDKVTKPKGKENRYRWDCQREWILRKGSQLMLKQRKRKAVQNEYQCNHWLSSFRNKLRIKWIVNCRYSETNCRSNEEFSQSVSFLDKHKDTGTKKVETWKRIQWLNQNNSRFTRQITQLCIPLGIKEESRFSIECAWRHVTHDA